MNPIFKQGKGKGIGYSISEFHERFDELCREHLQLRKANAFALIFYNFGDRDLQKILEDQGAFAQLDRLSGHNLTIFYLDSESKGLATYFNSHFLSKLGVAGEATPPCVVFFKLTGDKIGDIAIARLDSANKVHGLLELYRVIENYIKIQTNALPIQEKSPEWIKGGARFIGLEAFRAALRKALDHLL
jgi:hypothetical protein